MVKAVGELVKVTVFAALVLPTAVLANERLGGANVTGATPFPVRPATCVLGEALSTIVTAPSIEPTLLGEKLTLTVHVANGARLDPHVVVFGNSPLTVIVEMLSVLEVLVFFIVTVWAVLVVPTPCAVNTSAPGVSVTVWVTAGFGHSAHTNNHTLRRRASLRIIGPPGRLAERECCADRAVDAAANQRIVIRNLGRSTDASETEILLC